MPSVYKIAWKKPEVWVNGRWHALFKLNEETLRCDSESGGDFILYTHLRSRSVLWDSLINMKAPLLRNPLECSLGGFWSALWWTPFYDCWLVIFVRGGLGPTNWWLCSRDAHGTRFINCLTYYGETEHVVWTMYTFWKSTRAIRSSWWRHAAYEAYLSNYGPVEHCTCTTCIVWPGSLWANCCWIAERFRSFITCPWRPWLHTRETHRQMQSADP